MVISSIACAQSSDIRALARQAQDRSSLVKAALSTVQARQAALRSAGSLISPTLEVAPGLGFTNSNAVLAQELDFFGRRSAASRLATVQVRLAEVEVLAARTTVTVAFLDAAAKLLAADSELESARAALVAAEALQSAVTKQQQIGEAPKVHVTRAELEVLRANQLVTKAVGRQNAAKQIVNSLIPDAPDLKDSDWPTASASEASAKSVDILIAQELLASAEAQTQVVRSEFAPTFSAGIAADVWSLDRNAFHGDNIGLQVSFRMPLFDSGRKRNAYQATSYEVRAAQAKIEEAQRLANLRLTNAVTSRATFLAVADSYSGDVLPKGEAMLTAMREGYVAGLVTMVEVLEAQQTLVRLRQERVQAVLDLRLADVELWSAQMQLPGVEVNR
jgi:outer membrane protein TolC